MNFVCNYATIFTILVDTWRCVEIQSNARKLDRILKNINSIDEILEFLNIFEKKKKISTKHCFKLQTTVIYENSHENSHANTKN